MNTTQITITHPRRPSREVEIPENGTGVMVLLDTEELIGNPTRPSYFIQGPKVLEYRVYPDGGHECEILDLAGLLRRLVQARGERDALRSSLAALPEAFEAWLNEKSWRGCIGSTCALEFVRGYVEAAS